MTRFSSLAVIVSFGALAANAQQAEYAQCGGIGWTGGTTCAAPYVCTQLNSYYYQCLVGTAATTTTARTTSTSTMRTTSTTARTTTSSTVRTTSTTSVRTTTTTARTTSTTTRSTNTNTQPPSCSASNSPAPGSGKVQFAGINIAGFDFGCNGDGNCQAGSAYPPLTQYYGPDGVGQMNHFVNDDGLNVFRLPVSWQFLTNNAATSTLDSTNLGKYDELVQACLATGAHCVIDIHNYARYNGAIIGQGGPANSAFAGLWGAIASYYKNTPNIIFGIMNEPHDVPSITTWATTVQAAVTAIRNAGATSQICLLPGNNWTSAETFVSNGSADALNAVTNPDGSITNLVFDVHKYLDSDNSGTHPECVTNNIDNAFAPLAQWLRCHGRKAFNTETGGGNTASCSTYLCQQLDFLNANSDVYLGWIGWAAGSFTVVSNYVLGETPTQNADGSWTDTSLVSTCIAAKFH